MVIDEEIPLLRTFRAELAKRSSMLVDEDMEGYFHQLSEFEGYPTPMTTTNGYGGKSFVSKVTAMVDRPIGTSTPRMDKSESTMDSMDVDDSPGVQKRMISPPLLAPNRLSIKVASITSVQALHQSAPPEDHMSNTSQILVTVKQECIAPSQMTLYVSAILNPQTGRQVSLVDAIKSGLFDSRTGFYVDPLTSRRLSLQEAYSKGYISDGLLQQLNSPCGLTDPVTNRQITLLDAMKKGIFDPVKMTYREPNSGQNIPLHQAVSKGLISQQTATNLGGDGVTVTTITQSQAVFGSADLSVLESALGLADAIEKGLFDSSSGKIIDPLSGKTMTILEAVEKGHLNPSKKEIKDPASGEYISLVEAVSKGLIDPESGLYIDRSKGQKLPLDQAYQRQFLSKPLYLPKAIVEGSITEKGHLVDPNSGRVISFSDALDNGILDDSTKCVMIPSSGEVFSIREAIENGILDSRGLFVSPGAEPAQPIASAVQKGYLKLVSEEVLLARQCIKDSVTNKMLTVPEAMRKGIITSNGDFVDTRTGRRVLLRAAASQGLVDKDVVEKLTRDTSMKDASGKNVSLLKAIQIGMLDPDRGEITDARTGRVMTLNKAAKEGIISTDDAQTVLEVLSPAITYTSVQTKLQPGNEEVNFRPISVSEALSQGLLVERTGTFRDPHTGSTMPVEEAIQKGLLRLSTEWPPTSLQEEKYDESSEEIEFDSFDSLPEPGASKVQSKIVRKGNEGFSFTSTTISRPAIAESVVSQTRHIEVQSITDPRTKERISPQEAVKRGILDLSKGCFIHPLTGHKFTINEAIAKGLATGRETDKPHTSDTSVKEIRSFAITSVIHPRTKEKISVSEAVNQGILDRERGLYMTFDQQGRRVSIPISEAVDSGWVLAEDVSTMHVAKGDILKETKTFQLKSVKHPITGKFVPVIEAVKDGILDEGNGLYINTRTGEKLSVYDAIERKLIEAELTSVTSNDEGDGSKMTTTKMTTLMVSWVVHPRTGETISIQKAVDEGIIDNVNAQYINIVTGERMSINDAIDRKLAIATSNIETAQDRHEISSIHITDEQETFEATLVEEITAETVSYSISSVIDPRTMNMISYDDAVLNGILDISKGLYINPGTGETLQINTALNKGLIHADVTGRSKEEELLHSAFSAGNLPFSLKNVTSVINPKTREQISAVTAIKNGLIDAENGTFLDTRTNSRIPLEDALKLGFISLSKSSDAADIERIQNMSMEEPVPPSITENGIAPSVVDIKLERSGARDEDRMKNDSFDEVLNYTTDVEQSYDGIDGDKGRTPQLIMETTETTRTRGDVKTLKSQSVSAPSGFSYSEALHVGLIDPTSGKVRDPKSGQLITLKEAIDRGIVDTDKQAMLSLTLDRPVTLQECFSRGLIDSNTGRVNYPKCQQQNVILGSQFRSQFSKPGPLNLLDADKAQLIDERGQLLEPILGERITIQEAVNRNIVDGNLVLIVDEASGTKLPLKTALRQGIIDGKTCEVTNTATGEVMPLSSAIQQGLVVDSLDQKRGTVMDSTTGEIIPIEQAILDGKLRSDEVTILDTRTGEMISLDSAMKKGLFDRKSGKIKDSKTGDKMTVQDALKFGLLAVVGAPILAGKVVYDAVKSTKTKGPVIKEFTETKSKGPIITDVTEQEKNKTETIGKLTLNGDGEPQTTIIYAKPGDRIKPTMNLPSLQKNEPDLNGPDSYVVSPDRSRFSQSNTSETLDFSHPSLHVKPSMGVSFSSEVDGSSFYKPSYPLSSPSSMVNGDSKPYGSRISDSISQQTTNTSFTSSPFISKDDLTIDWSAGKVIIRSTGEVMTVPQAVQRGLLDSDTVEELAESADLQSKTPAIDVNWDEGTITVKETREVITIDESVKRKYIDLSTAQTLSMVVGKIHDVETKQPKKVSQVKFSPAESKTIFHETKVITEEQKSGSLPRYSSSLKGEREPVSLNELVMNDKNVTLKGKISVQGKHKPVTVQKAIEEKLIDIDNSSVLDPKTGDLISLNEAIRCGIFDPETGKLRHTGTGEKITLREAFYEGLIPQPGFSVTTYREVQSEIVDHHYSISDAIEQGLVDEGSGTFRDPKTGEVMSLGAAIHEGFISPPTSPRREVDRAEYKFTKSSPVKIRPRSKEKAPTENRLSFSQALNRGLIDVESSKFTDPSTGSRIAVLDAIRKQLIDPEDEVQETPEGFTLTAALAEGVFDDSTGEFTDRKTGRKHSLQEAIRLGFINGDSSIYDVKSGKMMTLTEALNTGRIDPKSGKFISKDSCIRISLKDAAKMGLVAFVGAPIYGAMKVKDYFTKDKPVSKTLSVSLDKSVPIDVQSTVVTCTGPENIEITEYKHKQNRDGVGDSDILESSEKVSCKVHIRGVRDSAGRKDVSLDQAIRSGIIDTQHGTYKNTLTGQEMSIKEALDYGFIDGKVMDSVTMKEQTSKSGVSADVMFSEKKRMSIVSVIDPNTGQELKLHDAVHKGVIDHDGKTYFDDEHGRIIPIMDAVNQKLVRVKDVDSEMKSTELYGESKEDTITQVKTLKINTVVDPATGHSISLQEAVKRNILDLHAGVIVNSRTGEEIPISEALKMGLVSGENSSKTETFETTSPDTLHLKSVFDPDQGQFIPVKLAIEKGIINPKTGRYKEKDGSSIPITEAVHEGKIKADQKMVRSPSSAEVITERRTFNIQTIVDPRTGQTIPVPQAVQSGILDLKAGIVTNTQTGEKLSIPQAIKRGYVRADSVSEELGGLDGSSPINNVKSVKDPRTGEWLSVEEAVNRGVLDGGLCKYLDKHTGETLELEDAARKGYVQLEQTFPFVTTVKRDSMTVKAVIDPKTGTKIPLQEAIRKGIFIPDKGIVVNLRTGERLPLLMAAEKGLVEIAAGSSDNIVTVGDTMITEVKDPFTGRTMSLDEALKRGIVDKDKHVYYDPKTGASMPLEDALKIDLITGESLQQNGNVDKETKDVKQINVTGVLDSLTNRQLTADQAIQKGIIDADMTKYYDAKSRTFIPMEQALQAGLVSGVVQTIKTVQTKVKSEKPAITYNISKVMDTSQGQMIDVAEAINRGVLDAKGNYKDTRRGETMPLSDAMKKGMVFATEVDGKISMSPAKATENYTFNEALRKGYIDEQRGLFTHPNTGKIYTVDEAVRAGMIIASTSKPYEYSSPREDGTTMSFQQAFQQGNIDPKNGQFGGRDRRIPMSIEEALHRQFLSPVTRQNTQQGGSVVLLKASPHTADRGAVVYTDIVDTKIPMDNTKYDEQVTMTTTTVSGNTDENRSEPTLSVSEALKTGKIDLETGTYRYPNTGEIMSVDEAVICGFLSIDKAEMIDEDVHPSNEQSPMSISDAITQGQIETDKGTFSDPRSGDVMSLQTALQTGFIQPKVTSDSELITSSGDQYTVVKEGSPFSPKMEVKVINGQVVSTTSTEIQITSGSATYVTKPGFMVDSKGKVLNTSTGDIMSISEAAAKGLIFTESTESKSEVRFAEGKIPSLEQEQQTQTESTTFFTKPEYKVDSKGKVVNTKTGDILPLSEALAKGLVFTESAALKTDLHVSEGKVKQPLVKADVMFASKPGFVIDSQGKVTQTTTGDSISLPEAIKRGLVFTETTKPSKDLFISEETMAPTVVEQQTVKLRSKPVNGRAVDRKADEFDSGMKVTGRRSTDRSTPFDEVSVTNAWLLIALNSVMVCMLLYIGRDILSHTISGI